MIDLSVAATQLNTMTTQIAAENLSLPPNVSQPCNTTGYLMQF